MENIKALSKELQSSLTKLSSRTPVKNMMAVVIKPLMNLLTHFKICVGSLLFIRDLVLQFYL